MGIQVNFQAFAITCWAVTILEHTSFCMCVCMVGERTGTRVELKS